ncbi:hypothetical protein FZ103_04255 [Streptomonospora sp. PA3]|uniref:hypothetical protein n=1 Tax=Streptomonospora sp. PA3 TaxID=2607326 RepID=UPI0012DF031E|nr:hypothetical protein [Streptomonospora sp. PA3]MUL40398.1 hypothetical protein [Streptomonospora sp. PA3]
MDSMHVLELLLMEARSRGVAVSRGRGMSVIIAGVTVTASENLASFQMSTGGTRHIAVIDDEGVCKTVDVVVADANPGDVFPKGLNAGMTLG